ncbi:malonate transporter subunit MadM [soil metagenome]
MEFFSTFFIKNGLIVAFVTVAAMIAIAYGLSKIFFKNKIPGNAIAIIFGLVLAYIGGEVAGGKNGIADVAVFSGFSLMGGGMLRDFAVLATALGASFDEIKKTGLVGILSLFLGVLLSFTIGAVIAALLGYHDAVSITTIGAGACTFIVGPITGAAIGASSDVIAISIASGVIKSVLVTIGTPLIAKHIGLNNPQSAMVFGGLIGTTSGVAAGLGATDPKLVPYGAMTATFYTGLGCLLCPSIFYYLMQFFYQN